MKLISSSVEGREGKVAFETKRREGAHGERVERMFLEYETAHR